jgi:S1-C subfamily serine protease
LSRRQVYQLQAVIRPGNSGGPFVSTNGEVYGLVFAASTTDATVGYAIAGPLVAAKLDQAQGRQAAVGTGRCAA